VSVGALATTVLTVACSEEPGPPVVRGEPMATVSSAPPTSGEVDVKINPRLLRRFQPLEKPSAPASAAERERVALGRALFYETRLSKGKDISCDSCHTLAKYGVDRAPRSAGHRGQLGTRNSPTVYNAAGSFAQFWDGRASNVEEQAKEPLLNPVEMALGSPLEVERILRTIPEYPPSFQRAFPGESQPVTLHNAGLALGAFERGLLTPARWDDFLRGDTNALTSAEKAGLKTFLDLGCMVCHTGRYLGGSTFERLGAVEAWPNQSDQGRSTVTGKSEDAMMFKVPTLRNVAKTAPYFHDASAATLDDAVRRMGKHQLGLELTPHEIGSIVNWLGSLTGEIPVDYIARRPLTGANGAP
jgi:cytochrome c peroxidase